MSNELPTIDHVEDSLEVYLNPHFGRFNAIYLAVIAAIFGALALLPVVRVNVSIQADGVVRPAIEKHEVVAGVAGYVARVERAAFARVAAGDPLFTLVAETLDASRGPLEMRLREVDDALADLADLSALVGVHGSVDAPVPVDGLRTDRFRAAWRLYEREMAESDVRERQAIRDHDRARALARFDAASLSEVEERAHVVQRLGEERLTIVERYRAEWSARADELRVERRQLSERLSLLAVDSARHVIRAPVDGTLEEMAGVSAGSFVQGGQRLAVISPDADLLVEVHLAPRDIGLIDPGSPVRLLIDAFPYADWGHLDGHVAEISDDFSVIGGRMVFRVLVTLDATTLALPNGARRELRKGMTLRARFVVAERTVWQLLRDDINDWINPMHGPARPAGG